MGLGPIVWWNLQLGKSPGRLTMAAGGRDLVRETKATAMEMNMEGSDPRNPSRYLGALSVYPWHAQESVVGRAAPERK